MINKTINNLLAVTLFFFYTNNQTKTKLTITQKVTFTPYLIRPHTKPSREERKKKRKKKRGAIKILQRSECNLAVVCGVCECCCSSTAHRCAQTSCNKSTTRAHLRCQCALGSQHNLTLYTTTPANPDWNQTDTETHPSLTDSAFICLWMNRSIIF